MYQNSPDLLNLVDEIDKCKQGLNYLLEISKQNEKLSNDLTEVLSLKNEVLSLKNEIDSIKEINNKTIDFLLLEIESSLDKQILTTINQNVKMKEVNILDKELVEKEDTIQSLKEEIALLKSIIDEKNKTIDSLRV